MKASVWATTLSFCLISLCCAQRAPASIRKDTNIPAEPLGSALQALAKSYDFQVLYRTEIVKDLRTAGAAGSLTPDEALCKVLSGTGLFYKYLDATTVTIIPVATSELGTIASLSQAPVNSSDTTKEAGKSSSPNFRVAQVGQSSPGPQVGSATDQAKQGSALDEIIVTAQKREERLQDVPIPITAIKAESLAQDGQLRLQDYYATVPGLSIQPSVESRQRISLRGVTTGGSSNPTVGLTVDGVPFGSSTDIGGGLVVPDIDPSDLARIEVLRGPQGTLYGASSMGGLVNFVTTDPSTSLLSGRVEAGTSTVHNGAKLGYTGRGAINVPITDTLAIRASGFVREDPGYIDNPILGTDGINKSTAEGGRASALWQPSQSFSLKLSALLQDLRGDGAIDVDVGPGLGDLQQNYPRGVGRYDRKIQAYSATATAKFEGIDITSVTAYNINNSVSSWDITYALGKYVAPIFGVPDAPVFQNNATDKFSEELRLTGSIGQALDWLVGGFFTHETSGYVENILAENPTTGAHVGGYGSLIFPTAYKEYAGFADLTYHFNDRFQIQIGGRESEIKQVFAETITGPYTALLGGKSPVVYPNVDISNNAFTYLLTPQFKLSSDLMVYARLASGYRPGQGNAAAAGITSVPRQYYPDKTRDYELGVKADLLDHMLSVDASLYYIDWNDIQLPERDPVSHLGYIGNGGRAKSEGVELSIEARPVRGLSVAGWVAWDDAELTETLPSTFTIYGHAGNRLPYSERFSGNFSVDDEFSVAASWVGFVGATVSYVGDRLGIFASTSNRQNLAGYGQTNLRAGAKDGPWNITLFANNVFDKRGLLDGGADMSPTNAFDYITPRTIGINVAWTF